jgi:hypothetical protein
MRFGNLKIGRRMGLVVVLSIIGTLLVGVVDAWRTRDMLLEDRKIKTQHVVEVAHGIVASYHKLAAAMGEAEGPGGARDPALWRAGVFLGQRHDAADGDASDEAGAHRQGSRRHGRSERQASVRGIR